MIKYGFYAFVSYDLFTCRITSTLKKCGHLAAGNCKYCRHMQYIAEKPQSRILNASMHPLKTCFDLLTTHRKILGMGVIGKCDEYRNVIIE